MALGNLTNNFATEWTTYFDDHTMREHVDVDLRGAKLKNITVVVEDNGTEQRVKDKLKSLERSIVTGDYSSLVDKALLQAQIDILREVVA
ncbi:hypothetical protein ACFC1L_39765 [Streptomyces sp. NPDC056210]|uniref:hypothetical protein n=1 Tax=Streptomyces sp. NPDC056210 TaxID=3345746 RepID=UPI0035E1C59D